MLPDGHQFFEYKSNRELAEGISKKLKLLGIAHRITVPETNVDNFLAGRVARMNDNNTDLPKRVVSIHSNAGPVKNPSKDWGNWTGIETWFRYKDKESMRMAEVFQRHLIEHTGERDRGIKSRLISQFYIFRKVKKAIPIVMTENLFYNNPVELKKLETREKKEEIIDAHVAAIMEIEGRLLLNN